MFYITLSLLTFIVLLLLGLVALLALLIISAFSFASTYFKAKVLRPLIS